MRKALTITLALVLVMPALIAAQPGPHGSRQAPGMCGPGHPPMGMHGAGPEQCGDGLRIGMLLKLGDEINLTDAQRESLEKMQVEFRMQQIDLKAEVEKAAVRLRVLMRDDRAAETEVMRAIDEVARLKADKHKMQYTHRKQIRGLLTDQQIDKLKDLRKERREKRCEFKQKQSRGHHEMRRCGR